MTSDNHPQSAAIALIERYYDAFNRGDREAMLTCLDDAVVHDLNQGARETGREAFAAFLRRMDASYREQLREIVVMARADGLRAAAEYVVHGQYLKTDEGLPPAHGQSYVLPGGAFFEIIPGGGPGNNMSGEDGWRITRVTNYYNLPDWIAQVSG